MAETQDVIKWQATTDNGRIPLRLLEGVGMYDVDLGSEGMMYPPAAQAFKAMVKDAKAKGVTLFARRFYRTFASQLQKWEDYQNGGNVAARPGTSNHGEALAIDFTISARSGEMYTWLTNNARRYGFYNNDAASEPWHWDYEGGWVGGAMTPEEKEEFNALKRRVAKLEGFEVAIENGIAANGPIAAGDRVAKSVKKTEAGALPAAPHAHIFSGQTGPAG